MITINNKQKKIRSLLNFWCLISTLLGLPWILGYFIIDNQATLIFSYLFTIINTSQGTIIFIFNCLISTSVRDELFKLIRKHKGRLLIGLFSNRHKQDKFSIHALNSQSNYATSNKHSTRSNKAKKHFVDHCLNFLCSCGSCPCSLLTSSSTDYSIDQISRKQTTTNYLIGHQYTSSSSSSSSAKNKLMQNFGEKEPLNRANNRTSQTQVITLNNTLVALPKQNIRMLSSLPYMKRTSSLMSSSTLNSNNPTQSSYISPVILINTAIPGSPPPPLPSPPPPPLPHSAQPPSSSSLHQSLHHSNVQCLSTFKTNAKQTRANYDENQYLTPEIHNYSALDTDFNTDTQYYMDNGLMVDEDDYMNNYDELDNDLVYLRSHGKKIEADKLCYLKVINNKMPNSSIGSTNSQSSSSTSSSLMTNEQSNYKLLSNSQNLKAKKLLQKTVKN